MVIAAMYLAAALLLAPLIFVAAEWIGHHQARPPHRVFYSVLAALLWPLLIVGLLQFAAIVAVKRVARDDGSDHDTGQLPRMAVPYAGLRLRLP